MSLQGRGGPRRLGPPYQSCFQNRKASKRRRKFMPTHITCQTRIEAAGNKPKIIDEYIDSVNSRLETLSIAHMKSPAGWVEPGQTPEFDEYTVVLHGTLRVTYRGGHIDVSAGQAVIAHAGEWVQYSTPGADGAEYIAV